MRCRIFLDTNVFIYGFEYKESNSAKIIEALNKREVEGIICEYVIKEVTHYFEKFYSKELANLYKRYLLHSCIIIRRDRLVSTMDVFKGKIKDKDLEQLAAVKKLGIKFLLSYDRDFENFDEYRTPKKFLKEMNKTYVDTEY